MSQWPDEFTHDANARMLVDTWGDNIRFIRERGKWLEWDGTRWNIEPDDANILDRARDSFRALDPSFVGDGDVKVEKAAAEWRNKSLQTGGLMATLRLIRADNRTAVHISELDANTQELNTPDGIINLRTGSVRACDPRALHTQVTSVSLRGQLTAPRWHEFLRQTFAGDEELMAYLKRLVGYSATGDVTYHVLPFLYGSGQNGKSVFMSVIRQVLGMDTYTCAIDRVVLMAGQSFHAEKIAKLKGRRLAVASEVNSYDKFDEARMKELTGGDMMTANFMRENSFEWTPTHHLWMMGNHQPSVTTGGNSFWRRLRLIPFLNEVPKHMVDETLTARLVAEEGPGILAWIVEGAGEALTDKLNEPQSVLDATLKYATEENLLGRFLDDCTAVESGVETSCGSLYDAYVLYAEREGERDLLTKIKFGREIERELSKVGVVKDRGRSGGWAWKGLRTTKGGY